MNTVYISLAFSANQDATLNALAPSAPATGGASQLSSSTSTLLTQSTSLASSSLNNPSIATQSSDGGNELLGQLAVASRGSNESFRCRHCDRPVMSSRFAPHLEKCMGLGRATTRAAKSLRVVEPKSTADFGRHLLAAVGDEQGPTSTSDASSFVYGESFALSSGGGATFVDDGGGQDGTFEDDDGGAINDEDVLLDDEDDVDVSRPRRRQRRRDAILSLRRQSAAQLAAQLATQCGVVSSASGWFR